MPGETSQPQVQVDVTDQRELRRLRRQVADEKKTLELWCQRAEELDAGEMDTQTVATMREEMRSLHVAYKASVESLLDVKADEPHDKLIEVVEKAYFKLIQIGAAVARAASAEQPPPAVASVAVAERGAFEARLPKIDIPEFSGSADTWSQFIQLFRVLVDERPNTPTIVKLQFLLGRLRGDALKLVSGYQIDEANYQAILDALKDRYENPKLVAYNYVKELFDLPSAKLDGKSIQDVADAGARIYRQLENLGFKDKKLGQLLYVYVILSKLDRRCVREWTSKDSNVTTEELWSYLKDKVRELQSAGAITSYSGRSQGFEKTTARPWASKPIKPKSFVAAVSECQFCCGGSHEIITCKKFLALRPSERLEMAKGSRLCLICLKKGHYAAECSASRAACEKCRNPHHTLLHLGWSRSGGSAPRQTDSATQRPAVNIVADGNSESQQSVSVAENAGSVSGHVSCSAGGSSSCVLLGTARALIRADDGTCVQVRVMLDQGSQISLIRSETARKLGLRCSREPSQVIGVGGAVTELNRRVCCDMYTLSRKFLATFDASEIDEITSELPQARVEVDGAEWSYIRGLQLADREFNEPGRVDVLLSASVVVKLLKSGSRIVRGPEGYPVLQDTQLGWILQGDCPVRGSARRTCNLALDSLIERFWAVDELPMGKHLTEEEIRCEEHFKETHTRTSDGRYVVRLPFRVPPTSEILGNSRLVAVRRFTNLERRGISTEYRNFMAEYGSLGHMGRSLGGEPSFYIPHHAVYKDNKIRVVFDGSAKGVGGTDINSLQLVGPTVQSDLYEILIAFRMKCHALTTDVVKMYRQILVHADDRRFQRIVWRESPAELLSNFELNTVTYGTACAPFLAVRSLMQLAADEGHRFPQAATVLKMFSFVDDIVFGGDEPAELVTVGDQLRSLLRCGGFSLDKWRSSSPEVLRHFRPDAGAVVTSTKVLGVEWDSAEDVLTYENAAKLERPKKYTKRAVLSVLATVYDPVGLLAPVIILGKILMQQIWTGRYDWDAQLKLELAAQCARFFESLDSLIALKIPRSIKATNCTYVQLVGFCDASVNAYAACVYVRAVRGCEVVSVRLLSAKTRVAPLKVLSIPRLELCSAVLLCKLTNTLLKIVNIPRHHVYLFTDSQISLCWLARPPSAWKPFVANRVAKIQADFPVCHWSHVASGDNAADVASRGVLAPELLHHDMWWNGPMFLRNKQKITSPFDENFESPYVEEERKKVKAVCIVRDPPVEILKRYSSWRMAIRITAWIFRFRANASPLLNRLFGREESRYLTVRELQRAEMSLVRLTQRRCFYRELIDLQEERQISSKSQLIKLNPRVTEDGVIRVGSRLQNSMLPIAARQPIVIPAYSRAAELIVMGYHQKYLHAGVQLTCNLIRQKYWLVPNSRRVVQKLLRKCVHCIRYRPNDSNSQLMGLLPAARVTPGAVFEAVGVDYAGPVAVKSSSRAKKRLKAWVAIFVCLKVKAIHIELVTDLSTPSFIAAFKRFISRRGVPKIIYSDNGTNFHGADTEFALIRQFIRRRTGQIGAFFADSEIEWRFIPPGTPHMGGIWESAVKSMKYHLKRVIGSQVLTIEELNTLLVQIEGCLNSRPISPLSENVESLDVLTPGHFLVGRPLLQLPERCDVPEGNALPVTARWEMVQRFTADLWKRWSLEYLNTLVQRQKWRVKRENLQPEDIVIIKDTLPPARWKIGRIVNVLPDAEGLHRVFDVKTAAGVVRRHVRYLVPILQHDQNEDC